MTSSSARKEAVPHFPMDLKKRRVNLMLDPDVVKELQRRDNASAFVNALLREKLRL